MSERQIKLTIDSRLENVFLIGIAVKNICSYIRLSDIECYHSEVSVVEAVNNVIRHAYEGAAGREVVVEITLQTDRIRFCVEDTGKPMAEDILSSGREESDTDDFRTLPEGGRGIFIVRNYMDEVSYSSRDGRNILTMVKTIGVSVP